MTQLTLPSPAWEPTLGVDLTGALFYAASAPRSSGAAGQGVAGGHTAILRSKDNGTAVNDHQTLFSGPPPAGTVTLGYKSVVYLCTNQYALSATIACTRSLDGGRTFGPATPVAVETKGDDRFTPGATCGGLGHGHGRASPVDGTAYLPRVY